MPDINASNQQNSKYATRKNSYTTNQFETL